ncbi:MAG: response regulator, partial [Thermodesulfovibrionales bacterium]
MRFFRKPDDASSQDPSLEEVRKKILSIKLPAAVDAVVNRELSLLGMISPSSSEYTIGITYVTYLASLPWNARTEDTIDLVQAKTILDNNHYGLEKTKERILEYLAVRKLKLDRKPRVLVVDNEEIARRSIAHALGKDDYSVHAAANGIEALKALEQGEYNVILTDLKMAGMSGMEVLDRVKARYPHTEVIMMTGYATIGTAVEAMKRGAFHYIAKPLNLDEV